MYAQQQGNAFGWICPFRFSVVTLVKFNVVFKHTVEQVRSGVELTCIVCCRFYPVCEFSVSSRDLNISFTHVDLKKIETFTQRGSIPRHSKAFLQFIHKWLWTSWFSFTRWQVKNVQCLPIEVVIYRFGRLFQSDETTPSVRWWRYAAHGYTLS